MKTLVSAPAALGILFILTFGLYSRTLPGEFYFDDGFFLDNPPLTELKNFPLFFQGGQKISPMRGISVFTFALNYQLSGWSPLWFRAVNIALHFLNGCLVWLLAGILLERVRRLDSNSIEKNFSAKDGAVISLFAAAFFLAHPALTSGVAYIFQRNGLLSTLFYLSAFYCLLRTFPLAGPVGRGWLAASVACYFLSAWSKEIGITFIAVVALFEWLLQSPTGRRERIKWYLPHIAVCFFSLAMVYWQMVKTPILKRTMYGSWGVWANVVTQWNVLVEYLKLVFWPHPDVLNIDRDFPISLSAFDRQAWLSGLILLSILLVAASMRKRSPLAAFSIFWFFIALSTESSVVPISEVMVEYRLYLAGFGFALGLVLLCHAAFRNIGAGILFPWAGALILAMFSIFTWQRNGVMGDGFLLWEDAARKSPASIRANTAYATYLMKRGDREKALLHFKKAVDLNEMRLPFKLRYEAPHNEWGIYLRDQGDREGAKQQFIKALRINRWYANARANLADLLENGDSKDYEKEYLDVLRQVDHFPEAHYRLGNFYLKWQKNAKAVAEYEIAIRQNPEFFEAYSNLGTAYVYLEDTSNAKAMLEKALSLNPEYQPAKNNLEKLLATTP